MTAAGFGRGDQALVGVVSGWVTGIETASTMQAADRAVLSAMDSLLSTPLAAVTDAELLEHARALIQANRAAHTATRTRLLAQVDAATWPQGRPSRAPARAEHLRVVPS
ncbi:hypothetical protein [Pseudactinotalea suaedae]|uniref:hypothetical protein n=1 Tax=Pseudactinotalea suaedae TaxID=1524924 RepID=UPI0012E27FD9|nr:hypothetical protein [Pseudactinotalea suaedae]